MKFYTLRLRDGDGQPINEYTCIPGLKMVREQIKDCELDFAHYDSRCYFAIDENTRHTVLDIRKGKRAASKVSA